MFAFKRLPARAASSITQRTATAQFHSTRPAFVKVGDQLPDLNLVENSPANKVNLSQVLSKGKGVVVGIPAAFTPVCSNSHVPGFISHPKLKEAGQVFVVSVNDPFVMKAWADTLDPKQSSGIRFLADPSGDFNKALDLTFDSAAVFGNDRSKRYALQIEDGKVKGVFVEADNTGLKDSSAEKVLG